MATFTAVPSGGNTTLTWTVTVTNEKAQEYIPLIMQAIEGRGDYGYPYDGDDPVPYDQLSIPQQEAILERFITINLKNTATKQDKANKEAAAAVPGDFDL